MINGWGITAESIWLAYPRYKNGFLTFESKAEVEHRERLMREQLAQIRSPASKQEIVSKGVPEPRMPNKVSA